MSCSPVESTTLTVLDDLAKTIRLDRSVDAIAFRVGLDTDTICDVLRELVSIGWVYGGPGSYHLTGAGHSHSSNIQRSGLLGDGHPGDV